MASSLLPNKHKPNLTKPRRQQPIPHQGDQNQVLVSNHSESNLTQSMENSTYPDNPTK